MGENIIKNNKVTLFKKVKIHVNSLKIKIIKGSYIRYYFTRIENIIRKILNLKPKKRKSQKMVIQNSIGRFLIDISNDTIDKSVSSFEYHLHHWIPSGKDKTFIDIGANIGFYSFFALKKRNFSQAYCFEASPVVYNNLCENIKLSKLQTKIKPIFVALGSTNKPLYLEQKEIHTGRSKITSKKEGKNIIKVEQTTFDNYVTKNKINIKKIRYIKIDVEGFENNVLKGMKETLSTLEKGTLIQIEIWKNSPNSKETKKQLEEKKLKNISNIGSNYLYIKQ